MTVVSHMSEIARTLSVAQLLCLRYVASPAGAWLSWEDRPRRTPHPREATYVILLAYGAIRRLRGDGSKPFAVTAAGQTILAHRGFDPRGAVYLTPEERSEHAIRKLRAGASESVVDLVTGLADSLRVLLSRDARRVSADASNVHGAPAITDEEERANLDRLLCEAVALAREGA